MPGQRRPQSLDVESQGEDAGRDRARQGVPLAAASRARPRAGGVAHDSVADAGDARRDGTHAAGHLGTRQVARAWCAWNGT